MSPFVNKNNSNIITGGSNIICDSLEILKFQATAEETPKSGGIEQNNNYKATPKKRSYQYSVMIEDPQIVCRILVTNIQGAPTKKNALTVDLLTHRDSLFDLVNLVFEVGLQTPMIDTDLYYDSLWLLTIQDKEYFYGWGSYELGTDELKPHHIDEQNPGVLSQLCSPIKVGQMGSFVGVVGSFDFFIQSLKDVRFLYKPDYEYPKTVSHYEEKHLAKFGTGPFNLTAKVTCDFLTTEQKRHAIKLRRVYGSLVQCHRRTWSEQELELFDLLKLTDIPFSTAWEQILQYGVVDRTKNAARQRLVSHGAQCDSWEVSAKYRMLGFEDAVKQLKKKCIGLFSDFAVRQSPDSDSIGDEEDLEDFSSPRKSSMKRHEATESDYHCEKEGQENKFSNNMIVLDK